MSLQLLILLLALVVEHQHFVAAPLLHHLAGHNRRRGLGNLALCGANRQHISKLHVFAAGLRQLLDLDYVSGCDAILLSPSADHRVHGNLLNFILLRERNCALLFPHANLFMHLHLPSWRKETFAEPTVPGPLGVLIRTPVVQANHSIISDWTNSVNAAFRTLSRCSPWAREKGALITFVIMAL